VESAKSLHEGKGGVPLKFGLNVLRMAEMIGDSIKDNNKVVKNSKIELSGGVIQRAKKPVPKGNLTVAGDFKNELI